MPEIKVIIPDIEKLEIKSKVVEDKDEDGNVAGGHVQTSVKFDYSASAVLLNNSPTVKEALDKYHELQADADALRTELEGTVLFQQWTAACQVAATAQAEVKGAIELYGSYQDIEARHYAIKQVKKSKQYHAEQFIENFPKFSPAVIEQTINVKALEGLIKGKLLEEDALARAGVITTTESHAFIVR